MINTEMFLPGTQTHPLCIYTLGASFYACLPPSGSKMCMPSVRDVSAEALPDDIFTCDTTLRTKTFKHTVSLLPTHLSFSMLYPFYFYFFLISLWHCTYWSVIPDPCMLCHNVPVFSEKVPLNIYWVTHHHFFVSSLSRLLSFDSWEKASKAFDMLRSFCWSMHSHYLLSLLLLISFFLTFMLYL